MSTPQSGQVDSRFPGEGGLGVCYGGWRFPQDGVVTRSGQAFRDEVLMDPGPLGSSRGSRGDLVEKTAVVGGRGFVDSSGGWGSMVEMIAGMLRVGSSSVELGASHIQMVPQGEHSRFRVQVGDGGGLGTPRSNPQCRVLHPLQ